MAIASYDPNTVPGETMEVCHEIFMTAAKAIYPANCIGSFGVYEPSKDARRYGAMPVSPHVRCDRQVQQPDEFERFKTRIEGFRRAVWDIRQDVGFNDVPVESILANLEAARKVHLQMGKAKTPVDVSLDRLANKLAEEIVKPRKERATGDGYNAARLYFSP